MSVTIKQISINEFLVNKVKVYKNAHGKWIPEKELTQDEGRCFIQYIKSNSLPREKVKLMEKYWQD